MIMKWVYIFLLALILAGCSSSSNNLAIPSSTLIPSAASLTATPIPKMGTIKVSTHTPKPPTPTPSITPTFDVLSVMTFTHSAPEECPPPANIDLPDIAQDPNQYTLVFRPNDRKALDYLNQGGSPGNLVRKIKQGWKSRAIFGANEAIADLTGDGIPEILVIPAEVYIFGCYDGEYRSLFTPPPDMGTSFNGIDNQLVGTQDMNLNGIPEIVIADFGAGGMAAGQGLSVYVYEWDGTKFVTRIPKWDGYEVGASLGGIRTARRSKGCLSIQVDFNPC